MIIDMDIRIPNTTEKKYFCCLIVMKRLSLEKRSYSITSLTVVANIPVGQNPFAVAVNPTNNIIYVTNSGIDTVSVIEGKTYSVTYNINVGKTPQGVAVNPSTNLVYVANSASNSTTVIDAKTNSILATQSRWKSYFGIC